MQADEEFRLRLRDDLRERPAPALGILAADVLSAGRRKLRRQRTLRAVGGTAAVAAVAVGSATVVGAFGADSPTSAAGAQDGISSKAKVVIPSTWTMPPAAVLTDPAWVTPKAIVAETRQLLPADTSSSAYSGRYGWLTGDPRSKWNVDGEMTVSTAKGPADISVVLIMVDVSALKSVADDCKPATSCASKTFPDGSIVMVQHDFDPIRTGKAGAYVRVFRKDGMSVQVSVHDQSMWTDDQLFAVASSGTWGSLKMDKSFVDHAETTITGDFKNPPA